MESMETKTMKTIPVIEELREECSHQIEAPPSVHGVPDKFIPMFSKALLLGLQNNPESEEVIVNAVNRKRRNQPFPASYAFNSLLRLFQMDHMDDPDYPYKRQRTWQTKLEEQLNDEDRLIKLGLDLNMWNVGSDVETRIAGPKLVAHSLRPELTESSDYDYQILNVGSARDHSLAMLASNLALDHIEVDSTRLKSEHKAIKLEETINRLVNRRINIGNCYGVDLWPLRDLEWSRFLQACRYYPSELSDSLKKERYNLLESIRDNDFRLHHTEADFGDLDKPRYQNGYLRGIGKNDHYDMIIFSTSLYQNYPEKRRVMINNALRLLKNNGLIVVQDFTKTNSKEVEHPIDQLEFVGPTSQKYVYTTSVLEQDKGRFTPFVTWQNGRCEKLRPHQLAIKSLLA